MEWINKSHWLSSVFIGISDLCRVGEEREESDFSPELSAQKTQGFSDRTGLKLYLDADILKSWKSPFIIDFKTGTDHKNFFWI